MKSLRTLLEEADPLGPQRDEPGLSAQDVQAMRRAVLGAAVSPAPLLAWPRALAVATVVVMMVAAGAMAGRRWSVGEPAMPLDANAAVGDDDGRRQVQFATPGGTRIIWTIDPNFQLREVMP
jgi:hypothetical protein